MSYLAHEWTPDCVGGVDTPNKLYHGTGLGSARKIISNGLQVREVFGAGAVVVEPPFGVYMAPDWWTAQVRAEAGSIDDDPGVVLVVKVKGLPLCYCRTMFGAKKVDSFVSLDPIPARRIVKAYDTAGRLVWRRNGQKRKKAS